MITATTMQTKIPFSFSSNRRRVLEKKRIQTLKKWHDDVKKIAKSELDFINSILKDDKNVEDRDWIRDDEEDDHTEGDWKVVEKDS